MNRGFKSLAAKSLASLVLLSAVCPAIAQDYSYKKPSSRFSTNRYQNSYNLPALQGRVTTVPAGTVISGATPARTITTQYLTPGDTISFNLDQPYYFNGVEVLPAGSSIQGNAVIAKKAGFGASYGQLKIMFNRANLPNGQSIPISGKLVTSDGTGILTGGTTGGRVVNAGKNAAVGAGAGALLGLIGSAVSGGKVGKGTAIMTGVGGGLGLGKTLIDKGNEVVLEAGEPVDIMLDQPLTVGGDQSSKYNRYHRHDNGNNDYDY